MARTTRGRLRAAAVCGTVLATTALGVPLAAPAGARPYDDPGTATQPSDDTSTATRPSDDPGTAAARPSDDPGAAAQPGADVGQLLTRLRTLYHQAQSAAASYGQATRVAETQRAKAESIDRQLADEKVRVAASREQAGLMARQMYRDGGLSPYLAMLAGETPQDFFGRKHLLDRAAGHQKDVLADLAGGRARLAALNTRAQHALDAAQHAQGVQAARKAQLDGNMHQIESLLAGLTAAQIAQLRVPGTPAADGSGRTP